MQEEPESEFFEANGRLIPHNVSYSPTDLEEKIRPQWPFYRQRMWPSLLFF
jgi:hypothetical protein